MDKFDIPEPKKIAPQLTPEQRQAMAPIDLLVQYIMPKLWDKVNFLEWAVKAEFHSVRQSVEELRAYADKIAADTGGDVQRISERVDNVERSLASVSEVATRMLTIVHDGGEKKPKHNKGKKRVDKPADAVLSQQLLESEPRQSAVETDISEPVSMLALAQYDAQADNWGPKIIDGTEITAKVVNAVMSGVASYSMDVMAFVYDLSEDERKVLCATFPDETMEESNG